MAKKRSFDIAAMNISLHPHSAAKYVDLIQRIGRMRNAVTVRGEYQAMLGSVRDLYENHPEKGLTGEIYKFFELDTQSTWFNVVRKKMAEPDERSKIQIPSDLKPHFSFFFYVFFPQSHRFIFEARDGQNRFSPGLAAKMLNQFFERPAILRDFGPVDVTVEPSTESLERILAMPKLRRLHIELVRPNADSLSSVRYKVMERLNGMNAESEKLEYTAQKSKSLKPDEDLKKLAEVAQSNGYVEADGYSGSGKAVYESTKEHPLKETIQYDPDVEAGRNVFLEKANELAEKLKARERGSTQDS